MSYRRCGRQYGIFGSSGFVPAQSTQIFFGTIIHQVLDLCHRHYRGLMGATKGTVPSDENVEGYFRQVEEALRFQGVRAVSGEAGEHALLLIKRFNALEGPTLYQHVHDTEFRLEADRTNYILRGVVDVLMFNPDAPQDWSKMEIWDAEGAAEPGPTERGHENLHLADARVRASVQDTLGRLPGEGRALFPQ